MCIMFFSPQCFLLNHVVPIHTTVNAEYYGHIIQINLIKAIQKKQPDLLRAASFYTKITPQLKKAKVVQEILQNLNIETLAHPHNSPDLAHFDLWLFPVLKESLRGTGYENSEKLTQAMTGSFRVGSRDALAHVFRARESRMTTKDVTLKSS